MLEEDIIEYFGVSLETNDGRWPAIYVVEMMMLHLLMFRFSTGRLLDSWCFKIYLARYELREITGLNKKNNLYNKNIVKYIMDSYDEIYRNAVEDYIIKANLDSNLIYGTSYFPKVCPWNLQELIRAPYQDLLKMMHNPKDDEDAARLITRCKLIDSLRFIT